MSAEQTRLVAVASGSGTGRRKARSTRKLRSWIVEQVNSGKYPGVVWIDDSRTMFKIPWKHAGRSCYNTDEDGALFRAWARFKGHVRKDEEASPAYWKTRLRCALNKSPEFREVRARRHDFEAHRVYRLVPESEQGTQVFSQSHARGPYQNIPLYRPIKEEPQELRIKEEEEQLPEGFSDYITVTVGEEIPLPDVQAPLLSPGFGLNQQIRASPQTKDGRREVKQEEEQLPLHAPDFSGVCLKRAESLGQRQSQTEARREETEAMEISSETDSSSEYTENSSDTDTGDDDCEEDIHTNLINSSQPITWSHNLKQMRAPPSLVPPQVSNAVSPMKTASDPPLTSAKVSCPPSQQGHLRCEPFAPVASGTPEQTPHQASVNGPTAQTPLVAAQTPLVAAQTPVAAAQKPSVSAQKPSVSAQKPSVSAQKPSVSAQTPVAAAQTVTQGQRPNGVTKKERNWIQWKRRPGGAGTREMHRKLEKTRRENLRKCFDSLRKNVPNADVGNASNITVLRSAIRYIQALRRREEEFEQEVRRLGRELVATRQHLAELRVELRRNNVDDDRAPRQDIPDPEASTSAASDVQVPLPSLSPKEVSESPQIKEELKEKGKVKQEEEQLPHPGPDVSAACLKREISSEQRQSQTEAHREETEEEDISSETTSGTETENTEHCSDTDTFGSDDDWKPLRRAKRPYSCLLCKKTFPTQYRLQIHNKLHPQQSSYNCSVGSRRYELKKDLITHIRTFRGKTAKKPLIKRLQCPFCINKYAKNSDLENHIRSHTGERPYSCPMCKNTYPRKSTLERHMRRHFGGVKIPSLSLNREMKRSEEQASGLDLKSRGVCAKKGESSPSQKLTETRGENTLEDYISSEMQLNPENRTGPADDIIRIVVGDVEVLMTEVDVDGDFDQSQARDGGSAAQNVAPETRNTEGDAKDAFGTDKDDDWEPSSCSSAKSTSQLSNYTSAPKTSASNDNDTTRPGQEDERRKHQCHICNKRFKKKMNLRTHTQIHIKTKPFACTVCNKKFRIKSQLRRHYTVHSVEKPYSCSICKKAYRWKHNLKSHKRTHAGATHRCLLCKKTFATDVALQSHVQTHSSVKPYSCSVCHRRFSSQWQLTIHTAGHTGVDPFNCSVCDESFKVEMKFVAHMRSHGEDGHNKALQKRFQCPYCPKSYWHNNDLQNHIRAHTGEKPFGCLICEKTFPRKSSLQRHLRAHFEEELKLQRL